MKEQLIGLILSVPGLLLALSMHEFAHGYAAYKMGDNTAKYNGRLSINPFAHLDPIGTLCLFLFHFGWAKPVPINPNNFTNRRRGVIIVSLAGPFMNFLLALLSALAVQLLRKFAPASEIAIFLYYILQYSEILNIGLMVFNLIPIPPLDGSKVLFALLPDEWYAKLMRYERYGMALLAVLLLTNVLDTPLEFLRDGLTSGLAYIGMWPFELLAKFSV